MRSTMKRFILCSGTGLLVLTLLLVMTLFIPFFFRIGLNTANQFMPVTVQIQGFQHHPGSLRLTGIRILNAGAPICKASSLTLEYRPLALLFGRIEVTEITLAGTRLDLQRFPNGRFSLNGPPGGRQEEEVDTTEARKTEPLGWIPCPVEIKKLVVSDSSVSYRDWGNQVSCLWDALDLEGWFSSRSTLGEISFLKGTVHIGRQSSAPMRLQTSGRVSLKGDRLEFSPFQARIDQSLILLQGTYSLNNNSVLLEAQLSDIPVDLALGAFGIPDSPVHAVSGQVKIGAHGFRAVQLQANLSGSLYDQKVQTLIKGRYQEGQVLIDSIELDNAEAILKGEGKWEASSGLIAGRFHGQAPQIEKTLGSLAPPGSFGFREAGLRELQLNGALEGTLQEPVLQISLSVGEWSQPGMHLQKITAQGEYRGPKDFLIKGKAEQTRLRAEKLQDIRLYAHSGDKGIELNVSGDRTFSVRGVYQPDNHQADFSFTLSEFELTPLLARSWYPDASLFSISGEGTFQGDMRHRTEWQGKATLNKVLISAPGLEISADQPAALEIQKGILAVDLSGRVNGDPFFLKGNYPLVKTGKMNLQASASLPLEKLQEPFRSFVPGLENCDGVLSIQGTLEGPAENPVVRISARMDHGAVRFAPASEDSEDEAPPRAIVEGRLILAADLQGPVRSPQGEIDLQLLGGNIYGVAAEEVHLTASNTDGRLWTQQTSMRSPWGSLSVSSEWEIPSGKISGQVESTRCRLGSLLAPYDLSVQGQASIEGKIQGTLRSPHLLMEIPTESVSVLGILYGDIHAFLEYKNRMLSFRCNTDTANHVSGQLNLDGERRVFVEASLEKWPLVPLLEAGLSPSWKGTISLEGSLSGLLGDIQGWKGNLLISHLALEADKVPLDLNKPADLTFTAGQIIIPEASFLVGDSFLNVRGTYGRENNLTLRGTLPLKPVDSLLSWLHLEEGRAEVDLELTGPLSSPILKGPVRIEAHQVSFRDINYPLDRVEAQIQCSPKGATLESLKATIAAGEILAQGQFDWRPFNVEGLKVQLKALPIRLSPDLSGKVQGNLSFRGNQGGSLFSGDLRILQARYTQDFDLVGPLLRPRRPPRPSRRVVSPFLKNMRLDLRVHSGSDLFIRNNIARVVLSTNMDIQGRAGAPVPIGRVTAEEGELLFNNKRFKITSGNLDFIGPTASHPVITLESVVTVQGSTRRYDIYLNLEGPVNSIELRLRSIPSLSQEDILFVLLTGKTEQEYLATPDAGTKKQASTLAAAGISSLIGEDLKAWTGVDSFRLEGTEGEELGVRATVEKQLSERMAVRGVLEIGRGPNTSEAQASYQLTDWLYLMGTQRTDGNFAVDIRLRLVGD